MLRRWLTAALAALILVGCAEESPPAESSASRSADLQPQAEPLQARIDRLIEEVERRPVPRDAEEMKDRGLALYAWANRRAMAGDDLPWYLPLVVVTMTRPAFTGEPVSPEELELAGARLEAYVEHLRLMEREPAALGEVTLVNPGPHPISSDQTLEIRYVVGERAMAEGARFSLVRGTNAVLDDEDSPGYTTASASRPGVALVPTEGPNTYQGGGFQASRLPQFEVQGGSLEPGDTVTFRIGDTSAGGPGIRMDTLSNDFIPIELYVRFTADGPDYVLPRMGLQTRGLGVARVHGFAPSVLGVGETFDLSIRSEDAQTNRATGAIPGYRILLNGESFDSIEGGDEPITVVNDLSFDEPGVYRFQFVSTDGAITGESNPILVEEDPVERIFWGETHGHSGMAEGRGTSDAYFEFGRDDARLDFLVHSEHDIWMDDAEWEELRANTLEFNSDDFLTYLGYEWTVQQQYGGHHNVVFRTPDARERVPHQTHPTLALLYQGLREGNDADDVLIIPHAHQVGDWRYSDPSMETLVEIQSHHGSFEWFGHMYLRHGHHIGFISASDDHSSHPGYGVRRGMRSGLAAVIAPEKTRDAVFDAMKALRTYAVMGDRMIIRFDVNGAGMGQRAPLAERRRVTGRVIAQSPIDTLVVMRNSQEIWREDMRTDTAAVQGSARIDVEFTTSSQPLDDQRDIPRNRRFWSGTVTVENAKLVDIDAPAFFDADTQSIEIDENDPNKMHFRTVTRGQTSSFELVLEAASADTRISLDIEPSLETRGNAYTRLRRGPIDIPAWQPSFELADLVSGFARRIQDVEGHKDSVAIRHVRAESPLDHAIDFVDESTRDGDYYTLRVKQENDQLGWSSPVWVGGYRSR